MNSRQKLSMKFRVPQARVKAPKQTRATTAKGPAETSTSHKKRKGPHTDLQEDPIEEPMPLYGDDDNDQDFTPMDEEPVAAQKRWPPTRSTRAREKAAESQTSAFTETLETQQTATSSSEQPVEGAYEQLVAFRDMVRFALPLYVRAWTVMTGMPHHRSRRIIPMLTCTLPRKLFKR